MNTYKLTLIGLLSALSVVGRLLFTEIPNVQPVTTLIIICGYFLGPLSSITLAVISAYVSNLFLGMGIWTVWQIVAWALIGLISGLIGLFNPKRALFYLVLFSILSGYLYGFIVSIANFSLITGNFVPYYLAEIPFDTFHAIGNGIFMILLFPILSKILNKYKKQWIVRENTNQN